VVGDEGIPEAGAFGRDGVLDQFVRSTLLA